PKGGFCPSGAVLASADTKRASGPPARRRCKQPGNQPADTAAEVCPSAVAGAGPRLVGKYLDLDLQVVRHADIDRRPGGEGLLHNLEIRLVHLRIVVQIAQIDEDAAYVRQAAVGILENELDVPQSAPRL